MTYADVGSTRDGCHRHGYHNDRYSSTLGPASLFDRAVDGLRHWKEHTAAGIVVVPGNEVSVGATHINMARVFPFWVLAPVRIVYVVDEQDRFGWAYGTLPGHPAEGEQLFVLKRVAETTEFEIRAFSRPVEVLPRTVGPVTRLVQAGVTRRYLAGLKEYAGRRG